SPAVARSAKEGTQDRYRFSSASNISSTTPVPRLQPISFFSTGSSGSTGIFFSSSPSLGWLITMAPGFASGGCERRLDASEEDPGNQQPDPDDESEQAQRVHGDQLADALLPQSAEIRQHADREERQHEKDDAKHAGLAR